VSPQGFAPVPELRQQVLAAVCEAPMEALPQLRGLLMEAEAEVLRRLTAGRPTGDVGGQTAAGAVASSRWLRPAEAAEIAAVSVKRLYDMARGKSWASRLNRRTLRINEAGFRTWLNRKS
jgi:hypothetical protein